MTAFKLFIYYASYAYFLVAPLLVWLVVRRQGRFAGRGVKFLAGALLAGLTVLAWARFVEPRLLLVKTHEIRLCTAGKEGVLRAAVFADTHNGLFDNAMGFERIVRRLNSEAPDFVLIPGDFTYYIDSEKMTETYGALAELQMPAYAVLGNHDFGEPGPDMSVPLTAALKETGINVLSPGEALFEKNGLQVAVVGSIDHWSRWRRGLNKPRFKAQEVEGLPLIYLQHNPDYIEEVRNIGRFDLMVTGHTHGGQVNLPFVTCRLTYACDVQRYGYRDHPRGRLFVTSGTGMTSLPMRFNVPPVIDMLELELSNCEA